MDKIEGYLEVGTNDRGEVVLNLDRDRTGHIVFSPTQARGLASLLCRKANDLGPPPIREAPYAVRLWINTTFHGKVREVCNDIETQALLKVGHEKGESLGQILSTIVASVVLQIAGMNPDEW